MDLLIEIVTAKLSDADLHELLGLFYRYDVDMRQLAQLATEQNAYWFRDDEEKYWHPNVFG